MSQIFDIEAETRKRNKKNQQSPEVTDSDLTAPHYTMVTPAMGAPTLYRTQAGVRVGAAIGNGSTKKLTRNDTLDSLTKWRYSN
ncbi:MAG: hypothetical protein FJ317_07300 [SAR202 cluster bacterium]|nr:hypothetical protein [SAR202 cluster bacterium]